MRLIQLDLTAGLWAGQFKSLCTDEDMGVSRRRSSWAKVTGQVAGRPTGSSRPDPTDLSSVLLHVGPAWKSSPDSRAPNFPLDLPPRKELVVSADQIDQVELDQTGSQRPSGTEWWRKEHVPQ